MMRKTIRVHRKNSAFTYAVLESLEGMASFSTLPDTPGQAFRDLELAIPTGFINEIEIVLEGLRKKFPVIEVK